MNHLTQSLRRLAAAALVLLSLPVFSQLSGTYTIDPSGTGTTNYASFSAAVTALTTNGVSGPVTFNVTQGTYTEQVTINAITGTSTTNKVTFKAATANTLPVNVTFAGATAATNNWTLRLNGVNNLEFDGIKFSNTTPAVGTALPFSCNVNLNGTTSNIAFLNCSFTGSNTLGSTNHAFFFETGSFQTGAWTFNNCQFINTSRGINLNASATNSLTALTVTGCTFNTLDRGLTASNGTGAIVAGSTATITNNTFAAPSAAIGYFSVWLGGVATATVTGNTLNNYSGISVNSATVANVSNNNVTGGNFAQGISASGLTATPVAAVISNNTLSANSSISVFTGLGAVINQNTSGSISVSSTNTATVTNNTITTTGSGISLSSAAGTTTTNTGSVVQGFVITNNQITMNSGDGIYVAGYNIATGAGLISNNTISANPGTSSCRGIYPYQCKNVNIYHNTITMVGGSATAGRALYINNVATGFAASGVNIQNNIFENTGPGYVAEVATTSALGMVGSMSNNVYFGNTVNPFRLNSVNQVTLADWQTASTKDAASVWGDVIFYAPSDLHVQNAAPNNIGTPLSLVTTDMDGQNRSATTPDAGADEYTPLSCVSATVITVPTIGGNTATVSWTTANTPVSYKVRHRTNGAGVWTEGTQTTTTKNLTGLQSYTAYEVQVKEFCSATDSSIWSPSTVFTTAITPNWIENFQVAVPTVGWSRAKGRALNPTVFTSTTTSDWGQDDYGNLVPNGPNGKSARVNLWSTNHFNWLITPSIEIPNNVNSYQIEYDLALTNWNAITASTLGVDDTLALIVSLDNGLTWNKSNAVITYHAASAITPAGGHVIIPVPAAWKGNTIKLAWYSQSTLSNADNDVFVDNFEIKVSATCPITATPTVPAVTTCGPQAVTLSASWSNPAYQHFWLSPTGAAIGRGNTFTTPVISASTTQDSRLFAADNSVSAVSGGPQITLTNPAGGAGNFTNGMWYTSTTPFSLDSATVRVSRSATAPGGVGTVKFRVNISEKAGTHAGNTGALLYSSDTITVSTTSTTGELQRIFVNLPTLTGSYYINLQFFGTPTASLFRSTALPTGTTYPYALGGLGTLDSVQLGLTTSGNTRIYYLFNWKMTAACLGPIVSTNVTYASVPSVTLPHVSDFATGAPCNWVATAASGATWQAKAGYTGNGYTATTLNGTPFVMVDDDAAGSSAATPNSVLNTPSFPALGYDTLTMKFLSVFKGGSWGGKGYVEVWSPTNGVFGWQTIDSLSADEGIGAAATGWAAVSKTYNVTAHQSNQFKARFRYDDKGNWAGWWAMDDFQLYGTLSPTGNVRVAVTHDIYGSEVSWKITNTANKLVYAQRGPFTDVNPYNAAAATRIDTVAIPLTGNYEFRLIDSYGDGLYDGTNTGTYIVQKLCGWGDPIIDSGSGASDNDPGGSASNVASWDSAVFNMNCVQYKNVTFNVDMNQVTQSFTTPEVNGFWNNWCGNCNPLTDANGDGIWTTTLPLPVGTTQEYKFSADAWTIQEQNNPAAPCTNGNATYTNRVIVIPATDTVLNVVCWSQCTACDVDVTLKVNMAWEVANNAISANGVHVAGDFQGWNPATTLMTDANNDGIYEVTINVPANSSIQYKFINGNAWGQDEPVPSACAVTGTTNRGATFAYGDSTLNPVCYGKCTDCAAGLGESLQNVSLFPNPTRGLFNLARMDAATEVEVSVLDLQGKVLTVAKWNEGVDALSIDLSSFANGVYMVRMTSEEGSRTMRVSVQK